MAQLTGGYQFSNVTNETLIGSNGCAGPSPSKVVKIATFTIMMICSLIGNVLVVAVFYRNRTLRTTVHYFIANTAFSDLIIPVIILPWRISRAYRNGLWLVDGVFGALLCKFVYAAWSVSTFVSIFSMILIAADRFHAILFSMKPALISRSKSRLLTIVIAATWVMGIAVGASFIQASNLVKNGTRLNCAFGLEVKPASHQWDTANIVWAVAFVLTSLSAVVLSVLYSSIIIFLRRQKNNLHFATEIIKKRAKQNRKITFLLVTVVVVFYVVWIPRHIRYFLFVFDRNKRLPCLFSWIGHIVIPCMYTVINPIVYYVFNDKYRQGFKEILSLLWPFSHRRKNCLHPVPSLRPDNIYIIGQAKKAPENIELNEH